MNSFYPDEWSSNITDLKDTPITAAAAFDCKIEDDVYYKKYINVDVAVELESKLIELTKVVYETLMENLHLTDGDNCTLLKLKQAIKFELDDEI